MGQDHALTISETPKSQQLINGVGFYVTNSSKSSATVVTGLQLFGSDHRLRVLVMREPNVKKANLYWDWRSYVEVLDIGHPGLSQTAPTELTFKMPVPIAPGETRTFYVYSFANMVLDPSRAGWKQSSAEPIGGICYRRFKTHLCCHDEHLEVRMANGNLGSTRRTHARTHLPALALALRALYDGALCRWQGSPI